MQITSIAQDAAKELGEEVARGILGDWRFWAAVVLVGGLTLLVRSRKIARAIRRRRPPTIHPKLQKYGAGYEEPDEKFLAQRRAEAEKIIATSKTASIAGYDIIEQVEAVFVDGFRRPEEALEGLKASAGMKGANALVNVSHERTTAGKCNASGDAIIVHKVIPPAPPPAEDPAPETAESGPPPAGADPDLPSPPA